MTETQNTETDLKTIDDLRIELGLPEHEQSGLAAWSGEDCYTEHGTLAPIFTAEAIATLAAEYRADRSRESE